MCSAVAPLSLLTLSVSTQWSNKTRTSSKLPSALNHAKAAKLLKTHKLQANDPNAFEILSMSSMYCKWVVNLLSRCQTLEIERTLSKQTDSVNLHINHWKAKAPFCAAKCKAVTPRVTVPRFFSAFLGTSAPEIAVASLHHAHSYCISHYLSHSQSRLKL